jgi:hypothetical protein
MYDIVEIRNINGEKINLRLEQNNMNMDRLGEAFAYIRIGEVPYLLVAKKDEVNGDIEGRSWEIISGAPKALPNKFFEKENVGWLIQMLTPFLGEEKLEKVKEVLEDE